MPLKVSRMDPFETYTAEAIAKQLAETLSRAMQFQKDADTFTKEAQKFRDKATEMQELLARIHERDRKRAASGND